MDSPEIINTDENDGEKDGTRVEILKKEISLQKLRELAETSMKKIDVDIPNDFYLIDNENIRVTEEMIEIFMKEEKDEWMLFIKTKSKKVKLENIQK